MSRNPSTLTRPLSTERAPIPRLTLSRAEAATALGICENTLRALIRSGALPTVNIGTRIVVRVAALEDYLASQEAAKTAEIRAHQEAAAGTLRWRGR